MAMVVLLSLAVGEALKTVTAPRPAPRGSRARESARTIQALAETPSLLATTSICAFSASGSRSVMRALRSSPGAGGESASPRSIVDEDELRIAPREPYLDMPRGELGVERQRRLGENVEEPELERRSDRSREPLACHGGGLVAERSGCRKVGLDCLNVPFDVHVTSI